VNRIYNKSSLFGSSPPLFRTDSLVKEKRDFTLLCSTVATVRDVRAKERRENENYLSRSKRSVDFVVIV
jgi:hypothetical protein